MDGTRRRGLTLIELLVVIGILGVLAALILPAVLGTRAAARRFTCSDNLRTIGLGMQNFAQANGRFPAGVGRGLAFASLHVQLLPFIEQEALHGSFNFADDMLSNENLTALGQIPVTYLCPADPSRAAAEAAHATNYAGNVGRSISEGEGVFINRPLAAGEIADGLSNTVGVSEWLAGPGTRRERPRESAKYKIRGLYLDSAGDRAAFARACEALDPATLELQYEFPQRGLMWISGGTNMTLYNHTLRPNRPSCRAIVDMDATTAGSHHPGGVNAVTMDGAVRFIRDSIAPGAWHALGSRAGGEDVGPID